MSCGVGRRRGSELALLCPLRRPVATGPIRPLAWEPPYAAGAALKRKEKKYLLNAFLVPGTGAKAAEQIGRVPVLSNLTFR